MVVSSFVDGRLMNKINQIFWDKREKRGDLESFLKNLIFLVGLGILTKQHTRIHKNTHIDSYTSDKTVLNLNWEY